MIFRAALITALLAGPALAQGLPEPTPGVPRVTLPNTNTLVPQAPVGGIVGYGGTGSGAGPGTTPDATGGIVPPTGIYTGTSLAPGPGAVVPYTCPAEHGGRTIASSDVYDGPPMTGRLVAQSGGAWRLKPHAWPGDSYYLSCEYGLDRPPLGVRLPARIRECKRPVGSIKQVVCK